MTIVLPPGLPVTSTTRPSLVTMVGVCELSIRLPGSTRFGAVPIEPSRSVCPGFQLKSPISLFSRNPPPRTTTREPKLCSNVYVLATAIPDLSITENASYGPLGRQRDLPRGGQGLAAGGPAEVDLLRQLPGVILADEVFRHRGERRIGQVAGAVEVSQTHRLDHPVHRLGRPAAFGRRSKFSRMFSISTSTTPPLGAGGHRIS